LIEDKIEPQGRAEDAAACNSYIEPFDVAGVAAPTIVHANGNDVNEINDNDNNIMSIATIPPANKQISLALPDTLDDDNAYKKDNKSSNDDLLQGGNLGTQGEIGADMPEEDPTEGQDQGVCQSRRKNK
jgi:hypothetical protein